MKDSKSKQTGLRSKQLTRKERESARQQSDKFQSQDRKQPKKGYNVISPLPARPLKTHSDQNNLNCSLIEKASRKEEARVPQFGSGSQRSNVQRQGLKQATPTMSDIRQDYQYDLNYCEKKFHDFMILNFPDLLSKEIGFRDYLDRVFKLLEGLQRDTLRVMGNVLRKVRQVLRPLKDMRVDESLEIQNTKLKFQNMVLRQKQNYLAEGSVVISHQKLTKLVTQNQLLTKDLTRVRRERRDFQTKSVKLNKLVYEIRKLGVDVDSIYLKQVKKSEDESDSLKF